MQKGIKLAFATALISGISIFANGLFVTKTDPVLFAFYRNLMVAVVLTLGLIAFGYWEKIKGIAKSDWIKLAGVGAIGGGIPFGLFFLGLSQIGAVQGNILNKTLFVWVALFAVPLLKEKLHVLSLAGYSVIFFALFWGTKISLTQPGALLVLVAALMWGLEHLIAKKTLPRVAPILLAWARMLFGLPFLGAFLLIHPASIIPTPAVFWAMGVSTFLLIGYMSVWYTALKHAPATMVSSILVLAPVVTMLLQAGFLQKAISQTQWQNAGLLALGVVLIVTRIRKTASYGD